MKVEMKLELVPVPVTDVDRAKEFYVEKVGFNDDEDHTVTDEMRFVQLTPPWFGMLDLDREGHHQDGSRFGQGLAAGGLGHR